MGTQHAALSCESMMQAGSRVLMLTANGHSWDCNSWQYEWQHCSLAGSAVGTYAWAPFSKLSLSVNTGGGAPPPEGTVGV